MHKVLVYLFVLCFLCDTHSSVLQRNNPAWIRKYFGRKTLSLGLALTAFCAYKIYSSYKRNPPKDDSEEKNTIPKSSPSPEKKISDNIIAQPTQKIDTNNTLQHPQKITSDNIVQKKDSEHPEQKHSYKNKAPVSSTSLSLDTTWAELGVIEEF